MKNMKDCPMCKAVAEMQESEEVTPNPDEACPMCEIGLVVTALARQKVPREAIILMLADVVKTFLPVIGKKPIAAGLVGPDGKPLH